MTPVTELLLGVVAVVISENYTKLGGRVNHEGSSSG
jgi:hypothetical protein